MNRARLTATAAPPAAAAMADKPVPRRDMSLPWLVTNFRNPATSL